MASPPFPTRLDVYCDTYGITLFNLALPCVICKNIVRLTEAAEFHEKSLAVLWKNRRPHLACRVCLSALAKFEQDNFYTDSIRAQDLAASIGTPLLGILIRCNFCMRLLSHSEKADLLANNCPVHRVRQHFRAPCRFCKQI